MHSLPGILAGVAGVLLVTLACVRARVYDDRASAIALGLGALPNVGVAGSGLLSLSEGQQIGCYELVCISPVSGFARGIAAEGFPEAETVENSRRFTAGRIFKIMGDYGVPAYKNGTGAIYDVDTGLLGPLVT